MALFGGKKAESQDEARNPKKARRFFDHAKTVADSRNYDYAIECFVNGLRFEPDSMDQHEALREVAKKRKAAGGKPAGLKEQFTHGRGKSALEKMLGAEFLWSKDPLNAALALKVMENAAEADLEEVAHWAGEFVLEANRASKSPDRKIYMSLRDIFGKIGAFEKAVEACRMVVMLDQSAGRNVGQLLNELKNLEAELTIQKSNIGKEGTTFTGDEKQRAREQDESIAGSADALAQSIQRNKAAWDAKPDDVDLFQKYVRALVATEEESRENEAIAALQVGHKKFNQYRFKMQVGDLKIKQYNRRLRDLKKQESEVSDPAARKELQAKIKKHSEEQILFELAEYKERVQNYPTDMQLKFNLGRRQLLAGDHDSAITSFQESQADPKWRSQSLRYLGEAFAKKSWIDEAIDTFRRGIEAHPVDDDRLALELRYELMRSLEVSAQNDQDAALAEEAARIASQIAQSDINYKDIRECVDRLKKLSRQLKDGAAAS